MEVNQIIDEDSVRARFQQESILGKSVNQNIEGVVNKIHGSHKHTELTEMIKSASGEDDSIADSNISECLHATSSDASKKTGKHKKGVYCIYCNSTVVSFSNHLTKYHKDEFQVKNILSLPAKSKQRNAMILALRNKGKMKKGQKHSISPDIQNKADQHCSQCKMLFSQDRLKVHEIICKKSKKAVKEDAPILFHDLKNDGINKSQNNNENYVCNIALDLNKETGSQTNTTAGINNKSNVELNNPSSCIDNIMAMFFSIHSEEFYTNTFYTHVKANKIPMEAKQELYILFYKVYCIIKGNPFDNLISSKTEELAKLIQDTERLNPSMFYFCHTLTPQEYKRFKGKNKNSARYVPSIKKYVILKLPIYIHFWLKECGKIGKLYEEQLADIFSLTDHHEIELSQLTFIPPGKDKSSELFVDLFMFDQYVALQGNISYMMLLRDNMNLVAFCELLEIIYCKTVLLNDQSLQTVAKLTLDCYYDQSKQVFNNPASIENVTNILLKRFKGVRVSVGTKSTTIMFSLEIQKYIDLINKLRYNFVDEDNSYLFCNIGNCDTNEILQEHIKKVNLKRSQEIMNRSPEIDTFFKLYLMNQEEMREVNQLIQEKSGNVTKYPISEDLEEDMEDFSDEFSNEGSSTVQYWTDKQKYVVLNYFDSHIQNKRPPRRRECEKLINHYPDILKNKDWLKIKVFVQNIYSKRYRKRQDFTKIKEAISLQTDVAPIKKPTLTPKRLLVPWTNEQRSVVKDFFKNHIESKKPAKAHECEELISLHPTLLSNKNWLKIKVFVQNCYRTKKSKSP